MKRKNENIISPVLDILTIPFKEFAEISPTGIYITDKSGNCLYVNPAWCRMSGLSVKEAIGNGWEKAIHPQDRDRVFSEWKRFIRGEIPWQSEYRFLDKRGHICWINGIAKLVTGKNGDVEGILGINIDISLRKKYASDLDESETRYRYLFEKSIDAILLTSPDGMIYSANTAACKLLEWSEEEICKIGRNGIVHLKNPNLKNVLKKRAVSGSFFGELLLVKKSGAKFPAEVSTAVFTGADGKQMISMIIRDITEQKKILRRMKESQKKLQKLTMHMEEVRENERTQIAMNLHDDLGQNLTVLNLGITWIDSRIGVQSQDVRRKLKEMSLIIHEAIESIREISSSLRPLILFELGLVPAIDWQLKKFEKQSGIKYHFNYKPEEFKIDDQISLILFRILQESLTNIIRHAKASVVEVELRVIKKEIEMRIIDNGIGIYKEKINSLTSFGIAGIQERIRSVCGKVTIKGEKGFGTEIKITVPLLKRQML